jgi:hypothetical protein
MKADVEEGVSPDERCVDRYVELTGQLSNPAVSLQRLLDGVTPQTRGPKDAASSAATRQKQVRLSRHQQLELVERHRDGALQRELAAAYGIHRSTVAAIVQRSGHRS